MGVETCVNVLMEIRWFAESDGGWFGEKVPG